MGERAVNLALPFARGSATSRAAAVAADHRMLTDKERIFRFIHQRGDHGATADEVLIAFPDLGHQTAASRVSCMYSRDGVLMPSGRTRLTRSGREAVVWLVDPNPQYKARRPLRPNKVVVGTALAEIKALLAATQHEPSKELRALSAWLVGCVRDTVGIDDTRKDST